jgi:osmoprotectant transport system substrate-binding protein
MSLAKRTSIVGVVVLLALFLAACGRSGGRSAGAFVTDDDAITVGSFDFPESVLLAELYAEALESAGFKVKRAFGLGPRELVEPALERGLVEFVPEYLGTSVQFLTRGAAGSSSDVESSRRTLQEAFDRRGVELLASAPAEDANAIAVTPQTASRYGLSKVSDLASVAAQLVFGGPPECPDRPLCLPGLESTYGLHFKKFVPLDTGGPVTVAALAAGHIDVALLFTTSGDIRARHFVVLGDDRALQPAENVTPVIRRDAMATFGPGLNEVVDRVSMSLTTEALAGLNQLVSLGRPPAAVAAEWLRTNSILKG